MIEIRAEIIPNEQQRYPTVGDWVFDGEVLDVKVSSMKNSDYEFLVSIHEFIEAYLCFKRGIKEEDVTNFDIAFEEGRLEGNTYEPGNHPQAPYNKEHCFATEIEMKIAKELGVNWEEYDETVSAL